MAKLRKMLGRIDEPAVVALMRLIETQSARTLTAWATECAARRYLPILKEYCGDTLRVENAVGAVRRCLNGDMTLKEARPVLADARKAAGELADEPAAQAATRAVATACGTLLTPTNALGFTFYGAAASAYSGAGLSETPAVYDALATAELESLLAELRGIAVPDEPNPAKIDWNC